MNGDIQKSKKAKGYIMYHKKLPYGVWNDEIWTPLQCGTDNNGPILDYPGWHDNEGHNISKWNPLFLELTAMYYFWWNVLPQWPECEYVLQCQYRRRFDIKSIEQLDEIFATHDVITCQPLNLALTVAQQYSFCHSTEDIERAERIVKELYPDYEEDWGKYISSGHTLYYSNGIILKTPDFIKYCDWLFPIYERYMGEMGWATPEDHKKYIKEQMAAGLRKNVNGAGKPEGAEYYQGEIFAFLSERLWTLYVQHNYPKERIFTMPYLKMEAGI